MKLRIKIKRIAVLLASMSVMVLSGKAQTNLVFYHNHDQFNSSGYNPAFLTSQKNFTFSIFPLAGMSVGYNNQSVVNDMLTKVLLGDTIKNALKEAFNSLVKRGLFYQRFESSLLSLGYNSYIGSFNFRIREVEQLMSNFKGNFSEFITNPTFQNLAINQPQSFPVDAIYYREYSLGYAKEIIKNKLSVGVRAKLYFGKASALSEAQGELVKDNTNTFYLQTKGTVKLSIPLDIEQGVDSVPMGGTLVDNFTPVNFLMNSKNIGTGIDLGINYKINRQIMISASVVDLGKINWKNNLNTIHYKGKYVFPIEYTVSSEGEILTKNPSFSNDTTLQISDLFKANLDKEAFTTPLPTIFYAGLQYQINPKLNIGVVDRYISIKGLNHNSFSVSANFNITTKLNLITGYSILGNSYNNIPFALLFKWDSGQSYIGSDNVLSFLFPSISEYAGITFGTCFYLFRNKVKYEEPPEFLPFYKEKKTRPGNKKWLLFNK